MIRDALELACLAGALPWREVTTVGGWWNRRFDPEIDLVGADRGPVARKVVFAGSVKWTSRPFDDHDLASLRHAAPQLPGFGPDTGLIVVSLSGSSVPDTSAVVCGPSAVVGAWT